MDIQTLFYILASIFMSFGIVFFIGLLFLLWKAEKTVLLFKKNTVDNISRLMGQKKFIGIASLIGLGLKWFMERRNKQTS